MTSRSLLSLIMASYLAAEARETPSQRLHVADGTFALGCDAANLSGKNLRVEDNTQLNLTGWNNVDASAQWDVRIDRWRAYKIAANYAVEAGRAGSEFSVTIGESRLFGTTQSTAGAFKTHALGTVRVEKSGPARITVKATTTARPGIHAPARVRATAGHGAVKRRPMQLDHPLCRPSREFQCYILR